MPRRNLEDPILKDLRKKFVFLAGPRQVGKTTMAKKIMRNLGGVYLVYEDDEDRQKILNKEYIGKTWVCLDEFHKYPRWKNHVKGVYDKYSEKLHLLLTGSARLDVFQKSGDSLFGRYYLHHMHPYTCGELESPALPDPFEDFHEPGKTAKSLDALFTFGGFPEPFLSQSKREHARWSVARRQILIREDLRELTQVQLIALVEKLMLVLPSKIGAPFSHKATGEDLQVGTPTVMNWMEILQRLFLVFKIVPYDKRVTRSLRKQPKYFLYDWSQIPDEGARFENFVASHLFKAAQIWTDIGAGEFDLAYVRDRDGREVDFLVTRDRQPWLLVEAKLSDTAIAEPLRFFSNRLDVPGIQLVKKSGVAHVKGRLAVLSADRWLTRLP